MNDINRIAIDLAKNVFQVCALNSHNKVLLNKKLSRAEIYCVYGSIASLKSVY